MRKILFIISLALLLNVGYADAAPKKGKRTKKTKATTVEIGKTLPAWSKGCLDIHFINSARGECCFYIMPDGTTLLVDAGEVTKGYIEVDARPNENIRPYITYAKYIKHFLPSKKKVIDYCVATHFHTDHIGSIKAATETAPAGYHKSGLMALYDKIPYRHVLDSAFPNYESYKISGQLAGDWAMFTRWGAENNKFKMEKFVPGKEQITMLNKPNNYKEFSIFNICANGRVWGKTKSGKVRVIGEELTSLGNSASCGFHIRYGNFDYIACGDLVSKPQNRVAYYFRDFIGVGNLEAFKCHHHLAGNSWSKRMQEIGFNPRVVLNNCFTNNKPNIEKLKHVLPVVEGFFATNLHPDIKEDPEAKANKLVDKITAFDGHIVLRVMPGGDKFYVYMLDDSDFEYRVKFVSGPYFSK